MAKKKRKLKGEVAASGGGLRARLREREAFENRDTERARAKKILSSAMQGMGYGYAERVKLCVFLDDDFFLLGMDEFNLTLWRTRTDKAPKLQGYFPKLSHLLNAYLEKRINTLAGTKTDELIAVLERVEAAIASLEGKKLVPVPVTD